MWPLISRGDAGQCGLRLRERRDTVTRDAHNGARGKRTQVRRHTGGHPGLPLLVAERHKLIVNHARDASEALIKFPSGTLGQDGAASIVVTVGIPL